MLKIKFIEHGNPEKHLLKNKIINQKHLLQTKVLSELEDQDKKELSMRII